MHQNAVGKTAGRMVVVSGEYGRETDRTHCADEEPVPAGARRASHARRRSWIPRYDGGHRPRARCESEVVQGPYPGWWQHQLVLSNVTVRTAVMDVVGSIFAREPSISATASKMPTRQVEFQCQKYDSSGVPPGPNGTFIRLALLRFGDRRRTRSAVRGRLHPWHGNIRFRRIFST
jgi:hypothetical protein